VPVDAIFAGGFLQVRDKGIQLFEGSLAVYLKSGSLTGYTG